jgi:hypothetical protein
MNDRLHVKTLVCQANRCLIVQRQGIERNQSISGASRDFPLVGHLEQSRDMR